MPGSSKGPLSLTEVRELLQARKSGRPSEPTSAWLEAAAPFFRFDPHGLRPVGEEAPGEQRALFDHAVPAPSPEIVEGASAAEGRAASDPSAVWTLFPEARIRALTRLLLKGDLERVVSSNLHESKRPENELFLRLIGGDPPNPSDVAAALLPLWRDMEMVLDRVEPSPADRVDRDVLERRLAREQLLEPLRQITEGFVGRERELRELRGYVDVAESEGGLEAVSRLAQRLLHRKRPVFVLYGIGGIGKSALIARFLLQHLDARTDPSLIFALLDMERPELNEGRPTAIARAVASQLAAFHPGEAEGLNNLIASTSPRDEIAGEQLADAMARVVERRDAATVLLLLDTFEVFQRNGNLVERLGRLLEQIEDRVPRLRVVVSGRAPAPDLEIGGRRPIHLQLSGLEENHAVECLTQAGVEPKDARKIVKRIGTSPLSLTLAKRLYKQDPAADFDLGSSFWKRLDDERIQGELQVRLLGRLPKQVAKLGRLGMALRRLDADILLELLNEPCQLQLAGKADAEALLHELATAVGHVTREHDGSLRHRPDLRVRTLRLLTEDKPEMEKIHALAFEYYDPKSDAISRAEAVYHLLALGRVKEAAERWTPELVVNVGDEAELLPGRSRKLVEQRESSEAERANYVAKARELKEQGDFDGLLALLGNYPALSDLVPAPVALALAVADQRAEARELAQKSLEAGNWLGEDLATLERIAEEDRPGAYKGNPEATEALNNLLLSLFTVHELGGFALSVPTLQSVYPHVTFEGAPAAVVVQFVQEVVRRGLIDSDFFMGLIQQRPSQSKDILEVERLWRETPERLVEGVENSDRGLVDR